jgi:hypothetical protein
MTARTENIPNATATINGGMKNCGRGHALFIMAMATIVAIMVITMNSAEDIAKATLLQVGFGSFRKEGIA